MSNPPARTGCHTTITAGTMAATSRDSRPLQLLLALCCISFQTCTTVSAVDYWTTVSARGLPA